VRARQLAPAPVRGRVVRLDRRRQPRHALEGVAQGILAGVFGLGVVYVTWIGLGEVSRISVDQAVPWIVLGAVTVGGGALLSYVTRGVR